VPSAKKKILIVDDSHLIIERLWEMLKESENIDIIHYAHNFEEALDALLQTTPDVILLDINLPGINGLELLKIVKEKYPGIIVIMLTNQANYYYRQLCEKLGADYFIDKSKEFDKIQEIINA
jgi:DNA-binding NarL/FixJ family response regulator